MMYRDGLRVCIMSIIMVFICQWSVFVFGGVEGKGNSHCIMSAQDAADIKSFEFKIDSQSFLKYSSDCSNTRLTQFLLSLKKLRALKFTDIPKPIDNEVTRALTRPWEFLKTKHFTGFTFVPSGKIVASYNANGTINIANHYFEGDIVKQLSTIIHEAQHSEVTAPWHESCYTGQLIGSAGACDSVLETRLKLAGSYTVEYWFLKMVVHAKNKIFGEKSIIAAGLRTNELVAHRFNHVFEHAQNNDLVVVVT